MTREIFRLSLLLLYRFLLYLSVNFSPPSPNLVFSWAHKELYLRFLSNCMFKFHTAASLFSSWNSDRQETSITVLLTVKRILVQYYIFVCVHCLRRCTVNLILKHYITEFYFWSNCDNQTFLSEKTFNKINNLLEWAFFTDVQLEVSVSPSFQASRCITCNLSYTLISVYASLSIQMFDENVCIYMKTSNSSFSFYIKRELFKAYKMS